MYSNRRREHIHIIRQYELNSGDYTGARLVIFNNNLKYIKDYDNFIIHKYKSPKNKIHSKSLWKIINSKVSQVIKKQMINTDEDEKFKMVHVLYDSQQIPINEYCEAVLEEERISMDKSIYEFIK